MSVAADFISALHHYDSEAAVLKGLVGATSRFFDTDIADAQFSKDGVLHLVAFAGWPADVLKLLEVLPLEAGTVCAWAARYRKPILVKDTMSDEDFRPYRDVAEYVGFRGVYSTPLVANGQLLGVSSALFRKPEDVPHEKFRVAGILAQFAADAIWQMRSA
jgi:GAF domain-containing protein